MNPEKVNLRSTASILAAKEAMICRAANQLEGASLLALAATQEAD
jgi:hypothetical protein